jgi:very-short-patch-repair endonuclease
MRGKVTSCGCLKSRSERRISIWLDKHEILYERQKIFDGCKNINPLRFDFYIPAINTVIEYDGEFHYMEINGIPNDYEQQQTNDRIKDKYCEDNGIRIVRIPYWEKENIEAILSKLFDVSDLNTNLSA